MTYTFQISTDGFAAQTLDVTPLWDDALSISYEREDKDIFFRRMLSGTLTFYGDDYTTISGFDNDDDISIRIKQDGVLWWSGFLGGS